MNEAKIKKAFEKYESVMPSSHDDFCSFEAGVMWLLSELEPTAYMMVNKEFPDHTPALRFQPANDWHITWQSVPLYKLPEGINRD